MKTLVLTSILLGVIAFTTTTGSKLPSPTSRCIPNDRSDFWEGQYEYVLSWDTGVMYYKLTIGNANACLLEADGQTTTYKLLCVGRDKGNQYEIYFFKILGDDNIGFNANEHSAETPLLRLYYKNNLLYTVDDGILVKDLNNPTKRLFNKTESQDDPSAPVDTIRKY
ncbi:MAG: DUF5991 domain-containing protein [Sphingobacteriales bacterium JAD_PAG50586_3]|nr:MAG: DUF5991 domain-containing protein [Sphingobacteriales bacterium JAD_PAG50586_3]